MWSTPESMGNSGSMFYEHLPIPSGPGLAQLEEITSILPPLDLKKGPWLAGGAARRLLQGRELDGGDVDIFFNGDLGWKAFEDALEGFQIIFKSDRASTYLAHGVQVQIIKRRFYISLDELFKDFDFSVCQIATDGHQLACTSQAHRDIVDEILRMAPQGRFSKTTLVRRMIKYVNHGFTPEPGLHAKIIQAGLQFVGSWNIFDKEEEACDYDHQGGVDEALDNLEMNAGVMRTIARRMGLEIPSE